VQTVLVGWQAPCQHDDEEAAMNDHSTSAVTGRDGFGSTSISAPMRRPALKPGLRRLRRSQTAVQLGLDPDRALVLKDLDERAIGWLERLDGSREAATLIRSAADAGLAAEEAAGLLDLLADHGVLDDATQRPAGWTALSAAERARLEPDVASLTLSARAPGEGAALFTARRRAAIEIRGGGRVGASAAVLLAAAGVGCVVVRDHAAAQPGDVAPAGLSAAEVGASREAAAAAAVRRAAPEAATSLPPGRTADAVLLAPDDAVDPVDHDRLVRAGVPHLVAMVRETTGVVGPLVLPGQTSCLRCHDLIRTDRDPGWPLIAAQVAGKALARNPTWVRACDSVLATAVAVHAALQILAHLSGATAAARDGTLEITLPDGRVRRRSWRPHPACGCGWSVASAPP
jgi:hypothetical protein